ncbi:hypothetical protein BDK51DRAFT_36494 [Blyttiomyces helicus]|uniref:Uncharacterized protein n=1 Tax=Blyttiomyces helicus TaxID=388810 RepID=A0A4P9VXP4_9FUNG|nr:hypothetical protein BDK51DRAFT_36494 [Blyttiomyces helicus]|eukprot:RKO83058.1 hypothetical protein BDK51DRAFT_36494 [Blyttiomyces helicus]
MPCHAPLIADASSARNRGTRLLLAFKDRLVCFRLRSFCIQPSSSSCKHGRRSSSWEADAASMAGWWHEIGSHTVDGLCSYWEPNATMVESWPSEHRSAGKAGCDFRHSSGSAADNCILLLYIFIHPLHSALRQPGLPSQRPLSLLMGTTSRHSHKMLIAILLLLVTVVAQNASPAPVAQNATSVRIRFAAVLPFSYYESDANSVEKVGTGGKANFPPCVQHHPGHHQALDMTATDLTALDFFPGATVSINKFDTRHNIGI